MKASVFVGASVDGFIAHVDGQLEELRRQRHQPSRLTPPYYVLTNFARRPR